MSADRTVAFLAAKLAAVATLENLLPSRLRDAETQDWDLPVRTVEDCVYRAASTLAGWMEADPGTVWAETMLRFP